MFTNINAKKALEKGFELYLFANMNFLESAFEKDKVFLVNEETMDRIYPPRKRLSFDERCIKEMLPRLEYEDIDTEKLIENTERFWEYSERCKKETKDVVAVGLFVPELSDNLANELGINDRRDLVFICPERVNSWALKVKGDFSSLSESFIKKVIASGIIFHELAHKYMHNPYNNNKNKTWGNLIEESLANAISFYLLSGSLRTKAVLSRAFRYQPFEYRQYSWWIGYEKRYIAPFLGLCLFWNEPFKKIDISFFAEMWKTGERSIIRNRDWIDWMDTCKHLYRYFRNYGLYRIFVEMRFAENFWKLLALQIVKQSV